MIDDESVLPSRCAINDAIMMWICCISRTRPDRDSNQIDFDKDELIMTRAYNDFWPWIDFFWI